jgi:3-dehydroquinate synthase
LSKIIINTEKASYPVIIGESNLSQVPAELKKYKLFNNLFIMIDENVSKYHLSSIKSVFSKHGGKIYFKIFPSGEKFKSDTQIKKIYSALLNYKFSRDTTLIAIGGGVTGDIAGYAAATYMRGIQLVHIPTTLLAMIDSSIGGKTAINFNKRKNIIGVFYNPKLVFIDTMFLSSLPSREFDSALGELMKYGLLSNQKFYNFITNNIIKIKSLNKNVIKKTITESIKIKAGVVSQDEFEKKGIRKILNFGHSFAHAIESELGFRIKHGEAVAAGIICALFLSTKIGLLSSSRIKELLLLSGTIHIPKIIKKMNNQKIYNAMQSDKKNVNSKILLVVISDIGKIVVDYPASKSDILYSLDKMKDFCSV